MSLSNSFLEYGRHFAPSSRRRCRRAYAPASNTASHVRLPLGPPELRSSIESEDFVDVFSGLYKLALFILP